MNFHTKFSAFLKLFFFFLFRLFLFQPILVSETEGVCAMRLAVGVLTAWLAAAAAFAPTAPVASNMRLRGA